MKKQRRSQIARVLSFFREGDADEVRVVLQLANEIAAKRLDQPGHPVVRRRTRKPRATNGPEAAQGATA
jgi:hypothetical protein